MTGTQEAQYSNIVERIYGAALDDTLWSPVLDDMADMFGAEGMTFELINKQNELPVFLNLGSRINVEGINEEYLRHFASVSPRVNYGMRMPAGKIICDHEILSESEMDHDEYYTFMQKQVNLRYFISGQVLNTTSHISVIAAQRTAAQGHVDRPEVEMMKRLLPHLRQSMDVKFRLEKAQIEHHQIIDGLDALKEGCVLIDRLGNILHANSSADAIFRAQDGMTTCSGQLVFSDKTANTRYALALNSIFRNIPAHRPAFPAQRPSGKPPFLIALRYLPIENKYVPFFGQTAAMVFIRNPSVFSRLNKTLLQQSYELTPAESRLADALDQGLSINEVATEHQVSITTVRSQLYALMGKMSVKRQTDLIRLLSQYHVPFL